jgi:transposase-like protein
MEPVDLLQESEDLAFASPRSLPYLSDNGVAHDLIDELRWGGREPVCPRCQSKYTKRVNTLVFRQLYRCIDCGYMFNSLAGTVFHGSKMPVCKYLQFFVLHNALGSALGLRDIGYALDVSHKTATMLMKKADKIDYGFHFARTDQTQFHTFAVRTKDDAKDESAGFFSYCEIKFITVDDTLFKRFLQRLVQGAVSGLEDLRSES